MTMRQQMAQTATQPSVEGPPTFKWTQPGEEVFGPVTAARFDFNTQNGVGHVVEVTDEQRGPITVWLTSAQLDAGLVQGRNQLNRRVAVGDTVYIRFDGKTSLEGGKTLNNYAINVAAGQPTQQAPQQVPAPGQNGYQPPQPAQQQYQQPQYQPSQPAPQQWQQPAPQPAPQQQWQQPPPQQWPQSQPHQQAPQEPQDVPF